ncbi:MAG: LON peptidase substrate-binding domain-containing protein [Maricaulaceae bacterium]
MSSHYKSLARRTNPETIAIFPLNGAVLFPGCELPLNVFEPRYLNMVDDALKGDRLIGMIQTDETRENGLTGTGGLGRITQFSETDDGRYLIVLKGLKRFHYKGDAEVKTPYRQAHIDFTAFESDPDTHDPKSIPEALSDPGGSGRAALTAAMKAFAKSLSVQVDWDSLSEIALPQLVNQTAMISPFKPADKQSLLEADNGDDRRRLLTGLCQLYASMDDGQRPSMN